ncbi:RNA-directed DNA polymerase, eukaryota, reverse transcriptase zinc-binding domain protein, partial [Tanacetum coccineum]
HVKARRLQDLVKWSQCFLVLIWLHILLTLTDGLGFLVKTINNTLKDVEKIATSFYVSNFLNSLDAKNLWKEFQPFGLIVDAFIANKRSKQGKGFGFIRLLGVRNEVEFAKSLSSFWIGSYHVYVLIARFQCNHKKDSSPKNFNVSDNSQFPRSMWFGLNQALIVLLRFTKKSYASVTYGDISTRETRHNDMKNVKSVQLEECELIKVEDASIVVMVKVKEIDTISNMYHVCRNKGFDDIKIHHIGGLWVWIQFISEKSCAAFKSNESLKKLWITSQEVSRSFVVYERMIWIEICGLPLCAWGSSAFKKVANLFGKFKFFDTKAKDCMSMGRVCIATKIQSLIHEKVEINILESNDSDDEDISSNRNVDPIEALDNFIQH